jgi:hypothetical protein
MSQTPAATTSEIVAIVDGIVNSFDLRSAFHLVPVGRPDGDEDEDDELDSGSGAEAGGDEGEDVTSGDGSQPGDDIKDPEKKRLHDEAAKHRMAARTAVLERDELAKKLKEYEDKDKSELEKAQRDLKDEQAARQALEAQVQTLSVKLAFFESGAAAQFRNSETALRLLDLKDLKPNEEGEVDSKEIKARAEALGKEQPYLLKDEDDSGLGEGDGQASGRSTQGTRSSKKDLDRAKLAEKYPALRDRV